MVDRNVEESLDRRRMEIDRQHAIRTGGREQVGQQLGADRLPASRLLFLARVGVVRNHRGDARCRGTLHRIEHDQQLHDVLVHRRAERLDDEHVRPAHVLLQPDPRLPVAPAGDLGPAERCLQHAHDRLGQAWIRVPGENLQSAVHRSMPPSLRHAGPVATRSAALAPRPRSHRARRPSSPRSRHRSAPPGQPEPARPASYRSR